MLFSSKEMAYKLGLTMTQFYQFRREKNIHAVKNEGTTNYFSEDQFKFYLNKRKPIIVTETFCIYESRINEK